MLTTSCAWIILFSSFISLFCSIKAFTPTPSTSTTSQQCPCITVPGVNGCIQFDSRIQANTIDEAMNSFTDLTLDDADKPKEENDPECTTENCKTCKEFLKKKLKDIGMLPAETITTITANSTEQCNKYNFARKKEFTKDTSSDEEDDEIENRNVNQDDSSASDEVDTEAKEKMIKKMDKLKEERDKKMEKLKKLREDFENRFRRSRRQVSSVDQTPTNAVVGTRFKISCDTKGVATDGSGMLTLCSRCWAWRELPDNYYPRYMNELICDDTDGSCLSGYATCGISHRSAYVVRNDSGTLNVITLQSGSFCECRVQPGSALETLVTGVNGAGLPTNIPALNNIDQSSNQQQQQTQGQQNTADNGAAANSGSGFWY